MKKIINLAIVLLFVIQINALAALNIADNRKTVSSAGTAEALVADSTMFSLVDICAETDNTGIIAVGSSSVVAALATRRGVPLNAGDCYTIKAENANIAGRLLDLSKVFIDSTVNGDGVTFTYIFNA